ncbi:MAG: type III-A CRISPR-associated RAMP protein Csm5 [Blastocatellia bacterium]
MMTTTQYIITCLSPVHVGTGEMLGPFDGFAADKRWWRMDIDRVVAGGGNPRTLAAAMRDRQFSWGGWLRRNNIRHADAAVYSITSWFDPGDLEIREAIKDVYHRPYLPGSSIKGAIRTAILRRLLQDDEAMKQRLKEYLTAGIYDLQPPAQYAAEPLERELLGFDPTRDLMRSLHVVDSVPADIKQLLLGETAVYTLRNNKLVMKSGYGQDYRQFVEWFIPGAALDVAIGVNDFLFAPAARPALRFTEAQENAVRDLARCCNDFARDLLDREQAFYARHQASSLINDCTRLREELDRLPAGGFLLNAGWGGGWETKTAGDAVRELLTDEEFRDLRQPYELGKSPDRYDQSYLDHYFPHSRHLAHQGGIPRSLGWMKFTPGQGT